MDKVKLAVMHTLCAFGLCLQSELLIPGALPANGVADVLVGFGEVAVEDGAASSGPYRLGTQGLVFEHPQVGRYLCTPEKITIEPAAGVADEDVADYLIATALPALLWQRGDLLLHAAAVILPGATRAVAVLGDSGSGKSTLLHELVKQGATVVAEDVSCVRRRDGRNEVSGLRGGIFLRDGDALDGPRSLHLVPASQSAAKAALGAAVVLGAAHAGAALERLFVTDALQALLHHRHRPRVPQLLGLEGAHLREWASLAQGIPIYLAASSQQAFSQSVVDELLTASR